MAPEEMNLRSLEYTERLLRALRSRDFDLDQAVIFQEQRLNTIVESLRDRSSIPHELEFERLDKERDYLSALRFVQKYKVLPF